MGTKLTFSEYMDSKQQLLLAIENTPKRTATYTVRKYCKLPVGESKETKDYVPLKPKQKVFVEWLYESFDNPTPLSIKFEGVQDVDSSEEHETFWEGSKLLKWCVRNTREETD